MDSDPDLPIHRHLPLVGVVSLFLLIAGCGASLGAISAYQEPYFTINLLRLTGIFQPAADISHPEKFGFTSSLFFTLNDHLSGMPYRLIAAANSGGQLKELFITHNLIGNLQQPFTQLTSLQKLTLMETGLNGLPNDFGLLSGLNGLNLNGNSLTDLPPSIKNLTNLKTLELRGNSLTRLPPEIGSLTQLTTVDLRENQLKSLPVEELKSLPHLHFLYLGGNRLNPNDIENVKNNLPDSQIYF